VKPPSFATLGKRNVGAAKPVFALSEPLANVAACLTSRLTDLTAFTVSRSGLIGVPTGLTKPQPLGLAIKLPPA
jgi:hypothetical protein